MEIDSSEATQDPGKPGQPELIELLNKIESRTECPNCGTSLSTLFCGTCGQKRIRERLSISQLLREIPAKILNWESGLLFTFLSLCRRPGIVCRDIVVGKSKPYVNPVSYFLIGATLQIASLWINAPVIRALIDKSMDDNKIAIQPADAIQGESITLQQQLGLDVANLYVATLSQAYTYAAFLFFCLPLAFGLWVLHHRRTGYRFAENLVFAMYVVAQCLVLTAFTTTITCRINPTVNMIVSQAIYLAYILWAHESFYLPGWGNRSRSFLAMLAAIVCFFMAIILIFILTLILTLIWKSSAGVEAVALM